MTISFTNRAALIASVVDELDRDDLADQIPGFLALAESDIAFDLQPRDSLTRATTTIDEDYENLPSNWGVPVALHLNGVDGRVLLSYRTPSQIAALREYDLSGTPRFYTIVGTQLWFDRTPSGEQLELQYYSGLPALVADDDSNSVLLTAPSIYFYGTLKHSAPFLKDDARIALWDTLYQSSVQRYLKQNERTRYGPGPLAARAKRHF